MNISLTKLPWYGQVGAFAALAVAGIGAFIYYYDMPARAEIATRQEQLVVLKKDITRGLNTAKKLSEFQKEVAQLEARLEALRAVLPEEKDAADLLRRMQTVAAQSSLTIKSFKPSPVVNKQLHAEWPISLEVDGTYHNLAIFCDRVGKFTRTVNISDLDVKGKSAPDANSSITATLVATTFVLLDKPTAAKAAAAGAKPGAPAPGKGT
jgi:type IV pilus assembly protein PilO